MDEIEISNLPPFTGSIDPVNDFLPIDNNDISTTERINRNTYLNLTSQPVGISDTQTLTNKTLTSPSISNPTLSGTVTGTYTLGGTPTFPASIVTLTGTQTLTNKTLTAPVINNGSITGSTITTNAIAGQAVPNSGTVYGLPVTLGKVGANGVVTSSITNGAVDQSKVASGFAVQQVSTLSSAVATSVNSLIPLDDTIPQITEGTEFMTRTITPSSATNVLVIQVVAICATATTNFVTTALFQDAVANALAAVPIQIDSANTTHPATLNFTMVAGTTSSITFRVRLGPNANDTLTFNGRAGSRLYNTIPKSSIIITEYKA